MKNKMTRTLFLVVIVLAWLPLSPAAQDYRARITGTVLDAAGAGRHEKVMLGG